MSEKKTMKAAYITEFGGIDQIKIGELPIPEPKPTEVQIAVHYGGVNPIDWKICDGQIKHMMRHEFPVILGWDVAGVISAIGQKVTHLKEGDEIFAYCKKRVIHDGSFADYICLDAENVLLKPKKCSFAQAACIPLSSLTAWQSLFDSVHLRPNERILIHAGAGGVGSFAIQFAKFSGAHVITTASSSNHDFVKKLGADEVIDYSRENFAQKIHALEPSGVDVVYDTVGGKTLAMSYECVKEGGRLVTIAGIVDQTLVRQHKLFADFVFVSPNAKELKRIATMIDACEIVPPPIQEVPFDQLSWALKKSYEGHIHGKLVIKIR
ncbi:MAG: NADP-dependent oxidoreductase [Chlamydiia bacterium]|nr:NADP-dependent oxidoreductase [Chlamydiia bacterium]